DVREMDFGRWEGQLWSAVPRAELDAWAADFLDGSPHGGESVRGLRERSLKAARRYAKQPGTTLIVCHAGVVRALFAASDRSEDFSTHIGYGETLLWQGESA
ncbi:MAG: histidine phosphatase family protein, partial [Pseudomonadota bacterium]